MAVYKCAGRKRLNEDGRPICEYEDTKPWPMRKGCPGCGRLYNCERVGAITVAKARITAASLAELPPIEYVKTGEDDFDRVIGGGLVEGGIILFGGDRGVGKSSLLFRVVNGLAKRGKRVLYAGGEQNERDIAYIVQRYGVKDEKIEIMPEANDAYAIVHRAEEYKPFLIILDSLQVITCDDVKGGEGTVAQGEAVLNVVTAHCKRAKQCAIVINHVTKDGNFKGSATMEHLVDTLLRFGYYDVLDEDGLPDGDFKEVFRELSVFEKNRNGTTRERAVYEMSDAGVLTAVDDVDKRVKQIRRAKRVVPLFPKS